ncbi:hypothetical protein M2G36_20630 [Vibrio vulnificus]|nr:MULTISPECIES: hypothetical protein [Vibrio]MCG6264694.1 hypothetical protein [Vibrio vulnificus]MCG6264843.1 hypothetical protein [Vibrio vulnificus]MCG6312788.1 hypothetical protein [Vibrio vulnificus]MCG6312905.1 hypothetical protein [Vibrio vulnificus]MCR9651766.1 hypothetical protein [Vibrio parahaemolyticus]
MKMVCGKLVYAALTP